MSAEVVMSPYLKKRAPFELFKKSFNVEMWPLSIKPDGQLFTWYQYFRSHDRPTAFDLALKDGHIPLDTIEKAYEFWYLMPTWKRSGKRFKRWFNKARLKTMKTKDL